MAYRFRKGFLAWPLIAISSLALAACSGNRAGSYAASDVSSSGGFYKVGKPYQIKDNWYYPNEDYSYDETGIASWYGADFHGQKTANGELYNKDELTAAHRTLPMPSLARVTNLDNGRSLVVRVNDRGPFSKGRIIDVSQRSAQLLGFDREGTAKVRVQVLADESRAIADAMRKYGSSAKIETASARTGESGMANAPLSSVTSEDLPQAALPGRAEAHSMMATIKPVPEVRQLAVTGQNLIYVQAGSFSVEGNALKLKQSLDRIGATAISDANVNGQRFWRVRLGPIKNVADADALLQKVNKSGVTGARIIVD